MDFKVYKALRTAFMTALLGGGSLLHAAEDVPGSYFLIIDHSGSMLQKITKGPEKDRTRWDLMRARAAGFTERLPEHSKAWAGVFDAPDPANPKREWFHTFSEGLDTSEDRERLSTALKTFPEPALANGTWLREASKEALDQVAITGDRNPDAYMTVMVYTDGVDQGHGRSIAEMRKNGGSEISEEDIEGRLADLRKRHRNLNVVNVYRLGDESILDAHVIRLSTNRLQLVSPLVMPRQDLELRFAFRDDQTIQLEGRPLNLKLESTDPGRPLPLKISGGPFRLKNGVVKIGVEKNGDWPAGQDVRARLTVEYPKIEGVFLVPEGGNSVDLLIQGAEKPGIRDLLPEDGSFPVGREISFSLTTLPGCETEWNFGDGGAAHGNPVKHRFEEPGQRTVSVKVTDPRTHLVAEGQIHLKLAELKLMLNPLPSNVVPGTEVKLTAAGVGKFRLFEWNISGRKYKGVPLADGGNGTSLTIPFDRPGQFDVSVIGEGESGGRVETEITPLVVKEIPAIRLSSPAPGESLYFGSTRELRAEVEGVEANQVRFELSADGKELMRREVDVRREGNVRIAVLPQSIPTLEKRVAGSLKVEVLGAQPPLVREIPVQLESEPASIEILIPEGREPFIHRATSLQLKSNAQLSEVRWDFGDGSGWVDGQQVERHTWNHYSNFIIKARAKGPDGSELESASVEIKVPVRPVAVHAAVIYKQDEIGKKIAKVPVNSTLELRATTSGDVLASRWFMDGVELPSGQETITLKERGFKTLKFVADATPEAGGKGAATATVEFRTSDKILFWSICGATVLILAISAKLLLGNKWRFAMLDVGKSADSHGWRASVSDGGENIVASRWNWWSKKSRISLTKLDANTSARWRAEDALVLCCGGNALKIVVANGPARKDIESCIKPGESSNSLSDVYIKQWKLIRLRMASDEQNHKVGTINLKLPFGKPGVLGRWPDFLFFVCAAAAIMAVRQFFHIFY